MTADELKSRPTSASHLQAVISSAVSILATGIGITYLPAGARIRGRFPADHDPFRS